MEKVLNIGFDSDGVLYDTEAFELKYGSKFFKKKYGMDLINENGYGVKEMFNCSSEQEKEFWTKHAVKYLLSYKPRKGVVEIINKLRAEGKKVHIVTAKGRSLEKVIGKVVRFLFEMGLKINGIKVDQIHYCSNQNSEKEKVELCKQLSIDLMVEDKKSNVKEISKITKVLCMHTKNNRDLKGDNFTRVYNFDEVYTEIKKLESSILKKKNCFINFTHLSREEKEKLSTCQLKEYYKSLREYYLSLPFDVQGLRKSEKNFKIIASAISFVFNAKYKPEIIDEKLITKDNGVIFVANHLCKKDIMLILNILKNRPFHPLSKIELSEGFLGILHDSIKSVYVDRKDKQSRKESIKEMSKILLHNGNVLIFPEGTFNKTEANLAPFTGVSPVYLSQSLDKHIVPMAITNNYNKGEHPIVRIAEPLKIKVEENLEKANDRLWNVMNDMVEENNKIAKVKELTSKGTTK